LSEEEKKEEKPEKVTITITLPTKETIVKTLTSLFPGIKVEVHEEAKKTPLEALKEANKEAKEGESQAE